MLDITGDHIGKLNDGDLRTLIAKLCEAELRKCGLPTSAVTAGGDQNAPDGGIDVRVDLAVESASLDFIPKPISGFQAKCSDMPASKITQEMRPDGELRQSIRDLAVSNGAYVIVSSQGSTADSALLDRRNAMRAAISDLPDGESLHIDFYDRERVANWVRGYTGVGLWLRERIGEVLSGWRGYGNWAYGDQENSEYILDDQGRIVSEQSRGHESMPVAQGISAMRTILARPGGIIRLIGLSGMGKTRLVQALFDSRVGADALNSAIVAYTDLGQAPNPPARDMLHKLGASGLRAIVVVDNCNPITHRALVQLVGEHSNALSLITIEYDVADDEPEETQVFSLEPASEKVLVEILWRLTPHVSQADRHRIAEFSGGNARIALALARTVQHSESLGVLNDIVLFKRMFHQNQESAEALMRAAEACSLVYSFDVETLEGDAAELPVLAELADLTSKELFRHVGELHSRDIVQRRGRWRAVLPHAIANRLAGQALDRIPTSLVTDAMTKQGRERLLKSFTRRLGYLHGCKPARNIAEAWLNDPRWLANPTRLNELGYTLFHNLAPLAPDLVLKTIEAVVLGEEGADFLSPDAPNRWRWAGLLRALAYEPELFDRAAFLLARLYAAESENHKDNSARDTFKELFHIYLSGTHALADQRLALIRKLLSSNAPKLQTCGIEALDAMLEAWHFSSSHDFSFGARSRDFGWEPKTDDESRAWYRAAITLVSELAVSASPHDDRARKILAEHFRSLWTQAGIPEELEHLAKELSTQGGWPDGWIAVRMTIRFDVEGMPSALAQRLRHLEVAIRPRDLIQRVNAYVISQTHYDLEIVDSEDGDDTSSGHQAAWDKANQIVEELGCEVASAPNVLARLLPDLLRRAPGQHWPFGRGLALGTSDLVALWLQFRSVLAAIPENERDVSLMRGYIAAATCRDAAAVNRLLDEAVADPILGPDFPVLQASVNVDEAGAERLVISLKHRLAPAWKYNNLAYGRVADGIPAPVYRRILLGVVELSDGFPVAVDMLAMRLHSMKTDKRDFDQETLALGRDLLTHTDFHVRNQNLAYHLNEIATACLLGIDAGGTAVKLCVNLDRAVSDHRIAALDYRVLLGTLFHLQPIAALDTFLGNHQKTPYRALSDLFSSRHNSPISFVSPEVLLAWADKNQADRYPKLTWEIDLFEKDGNSNELAWSPLALRLLEQAPDRTGILKIFSARLRLGAWSGSLADALARYVCPVQNLGSHPDPVIADWARRQEESLNRQIKEERQRDRRTDESFE